MNILEIYDNMPFMLKYLYRQHTGTIQFVVLALIYAMPLFSNHVIQPLAQENLESILVYEFGVLLYGWFLAGLFFIPISVVDSAWLRRVCMLLACLLAIHLSSKLTNSYDIWGRLCFIWLLFVNYCAVFLSRMEFAERGRIAGEIGMRSILYIVFFCLLIAILDLPVNVESWRGNKALLFGVIYFSVTAFVEFKRYFPRSVNILFHLVDGTYIRPPKSRIRYKKGKIKAHILKNNNILRWPLFLLCGVGCTGISTVFLYNMHNMKSWAGIIGLWTFMLPFWTLGVTFLFSALGYVYFAFSAGPALLKIRKDELITNRQLISKGFIPRYSKKEVRENIEAELVCYKVSSPEEDIFVVEKPVELTMDHQLQVLKTNNGTQFIVECRVPSFDKTDKPEVYYVWHLQFRIKEKVILKQKVVNVYTWELAFVLPVK